MKALWLSLALLFIGTPAFAQLSPSNVPGLTVVDFGSTRRVTAAYTLSYTGIFCLNTFCDVSIATIPKKSRVVAVIADVTQAFVCAGTCTTSTLSFTTGRTAGGNEYLISIDADAAAARFGLINNDLGASIKTSATTPVNGGEIATWTADTTLQIRFTSGTGNLGTGTATNMNAGSITFYVTIDSYP